MAARGLVIMEDEARVQRIMLLLTFLRVFGVESGRVQSAANE
jgi:hypothetical protein